MFLRNYWYVAALDEEVRDRPLGRTFLGEPVVLFRTADGRSCLRRPLRHRHLPLSMGKIVDDVLQCHYHGLRFDGSGKCVRVPGQDHIHKCPCPHLSRGRALPLDLDLDGRSGFGRSGADPDFHWLQDPDGARSRHTYMSRPTGNWSSIICSISPISPSCMRPRSAIWRWSSTPRSRCNARRTASWSRAGSSISRRRRLSSRSASPPAMSTAGKSSITRHRRFCGSTSVPVRPAPALRTAAALAASACATSTPSRRRPKPRRIISGGRRMISSRTTPRYRTRLRADQDRLPRGRRGAYGAAADDQP